jgi:hypothetical protein
MIVRAYASPQGFRQALEQRLKTASNSGVDFPRRRQLLVLDRFLARVVAVFGDTALLKGGLVLELRLERARATKDVDLRLMVSPESVLTNLREAGRLDLAAGGMAASISMLVVTLKTVASYGVNMMEWYTIGTLARQILDTVSKVVNDPAGHLVRAAVRT